MTNTANLKDSFVKYLRMSCRWSGTQAPYVKFHPQANFSRMHKPLEIEIILKMLTLSLRSFFTAL